VNLRNVFLEVPKTTIIQPPLPFESNTLKENATPWFAATGKRSCIPTTLVFLHSGLKRHKRTVINVFQLDFQYWCDQNNLSWSL